MPTIGTPMSAAERSVSPAKTPRPPLYVGTACSRQISMEKYATVELIDTRVIRNASSPSEAPSDSYPERNGPFRGGVWPAAYETARTRRELLQILSLVEYSVPARRKP